MSFNYFTSLIINDSEKRLGKGGIKPGIFFFGVVAFIVFLKPAPVLCEFGEYDLKAVYMERITRFIEWPKGGGGQPESREFIFGILGEHSFGEKLETYYSSRKIKDKPINIRYFKDLKNIETCDLLYISPSEIDALPQIIGITKDKPVLTIGDTRGFAEKGVLVNLFISQGKIRFEINEKAFYESGISIDSLILKVSVIINPLNKR